MNYILVSDSKCRKAFDIINILSHEFPQIPLLIGVESESFIDNILHCLAYGKKKFVLLRSYDEKLFETDVNKLNKKYKHDTIIYIPVEEETTAHFYSYIEKNKNNIFKYLLPKSHLYKTFRNKADLNEYCLTNSIAAPKRFSIPDFHKQDYPIILKPQIGSGSYGIFRLEKPEDYTEKIRQIITNKKYLAQEMLPNGKEIQGAFYLCKSGKTIGAYTHKRIRTMPEEGGVTICSKIQKNDKLIEEGKKLLEIAKWDGLVMLEFLYDTKNKEYKLIEANPRLWGSIMLSEYSGANLLKNYVNICLNKPIETENIKEETYIRWFIIDFIGYIKSFCKLQDFWHNNNTCFINWTYSNKSRAIFFIFTSIFNLSNIKKLFKRL